MKSEMTPIQNMKRLQGRSTIRWTDLVFWGVAVVFILYTPFLDGVFFPGSQDAVAAGVLVAAAVAAIRRVRGKAPFAMTWVDAGVAVLVLLYVLGMTHAADPSAAWRGAWVAMAMGSVYATGRVAGRFQGAAQTVASLGVVVAVTIAVVGLANAWHQLRFPSAYSPTNHTVTVSSVFQYHNAFAAFEGAVSLGILGFLGVAAVRGTVKDRAIRAALAGAAALTLAAMVRAHSRGALLVWLVVVIGLMVLVPGSGRRRLGWTVVGIAALAGPGYAILRWAMRVQSPAAGWTGLGLIVILPALAQWVTDWRRGGETGGPEEVTKDFGVKGEAVRWKTVAGAAVGAAALIAIVVVAHRALSHYVQIPSAAGNLLGRILYWRDGFALFLRRPLLGWGAGSWAAMYRLVRSQPYNVTQVHSFFMQVLIDTGVGGAVALVVLAWSMFHGVRRLARERVPSSGQAAALAIGVFGGALFLHSLGDWDMAFLYLRALWFASAGVVVTVADSGLGRNAVRIPGKVRGWVMVGAAGAALAGAAGALTQVHSIQLLAVAGRRPPSQEQIRLAQLAWRWAPYSAAAAEAVGQDVIAAGQAVRLQGAAWRSQQHEALDYLKRAATLNRFDPAMQEAAAVVAAHVGEWRSSYLWARRAYADSPLTGALLSQYVNASAAYALHLWPRNHLAAEMVARVALRAVSRWQQNGENTGSLAFYSETSVGALNLVIGHAAAARQWGTSALHAAHIPTRDMGELVALGADAMAQRPGSATRLTAFLRAHPGLKGSCDLLRPVIRYWQEAQTR